MLFLSNAKFHQNISSTHVHQSTKSEQNTQVDLCCSLGWGGEYYFLSRSGNYYNNSGYQRHLTALSDVSYVRSSSSIRDKTLRGRFRYIPGTPTFLACLAIYILSLFQKLDGYHIVKTTRSDESQKKKKSSIFLFDSGKNISLLHNDFSGVTLMHEFFSTLMQ